VPWSLIDSSDADCGKTLRLSETSVQSDFRPHWRREFGDGTPHALYVPDPYPDRTAASARADTFLSVHFLGR
jgi:hypothetical protein